MCRSVALSWLGCVRVAVDLAFGLVDLTATNDRPSPDRAESIERKRNRE